MPVTLSSRNVLHCLFQIQRLFHQRDWQRGTCPLLERRNQCRNHFFLQNYIDMKLIYEGKNFFANFIYADTDHIQRKALWGTLTNLSTARNSPWFLTGDFNDIVSNQEKYGGAVRVEGTFIDFRTFHSECDLFDIPHCGEFLSWRGVRGDQVVKCRLNRAIANSDWFELFQAGSVEYLR